MPEPDLLYDSLDQHTVTLVEAEYIGTPEDQAKYETIGIAMPPIWDADEDCEDLNWTTREAYLNWNTREVYWDESPIFLYGEGGGMWEPDELPDHLEANFCINGGDPIPMELLPTEEGSQYEY